MIYELPELLTSDEVAKYFKVSLRTIYRWMNKPEGNLKAVKIGKKWRFKKNDLIEFLENNIKKISLINT